MGGRRNEQDRGMRRETLAIHAGYDDDPNTHSVAVPIYQTVAYSFDSADHAAALFNLEADGFRYTRISNPTVAVLERRVAALEGGLEALCVSSGQAAVSYAMLNLTELGLSLIHISPLYSFVGRNRRSGNTEYLACVLSECGDQPCFCVHRSRGCVRG